MGIFGTAAKLIGAVAKAPFQIAKAPFSMGSAIFGSPTLWGAGTGLSGSWRALKYAPAVAGLAAYGGLSAYNNLVRAPYGINSPRTKRLGDPGVAGPTLRDARGTLMQAPTMEFGRQRSYMDMNANGSMAFALHNRR